MQEMTLDTPKEGFIDITQRVHELVRKSGIQNGLCQVFVPHTTAGVTINENADPDVVEDMLTALNSMVPRLPYKHMEGNSAAHVKSSLVGCSLTIPVAAGVLKLGRWQGIYFCEFDGPRQRKIWITVMEQSNTI